MRERHKRAAPQKRTIRRVEEPLTWATPSANACAGIYLATRTKTASEAPRAFRDRERLWDAFAREEVSLDQAVRCARAVTSVGRHLVWGCVSAVFAEESAVVVRDGIDTPWDARRVQHGGRVLAPAGTLVSTSLANLISHANVPTVVIRDPVACESRGGVCARCMGLDPDDFTWLQPDDAIGARAAQRIACESRKFGRLRAFHIC